MYFIGEGLMHFKSRKLRLSRRDLKRTQDAFAREGKGSILRSLFEEAVLIFKNNNLLSLILVAAISIGIYSSLANAGNLNPPSGAPTPTMNSLQELGSVLVGSADTSGISADIDGNINEQLKYIASVIGAGYTYGDEDASEVLTTAAGAGTYNAANLTPENVANGVEFGVGQAGTLLGEIFNGTDTAEAFPGGSQEDGGVDDYNFGGSPPSDRYETSWTPCNSGNNWCGLGVNGEDVASVKDNATGIIWSYPCSGADCVNMSNDTADLYDWSTALTNCSAGAHGKTGWTLPHQKQLMQAYIDGAYGNVESIGENDRHYWSATTWSAVSSFAWYLFLARGDASMYGKTSTAYNRCVQLAP